MVKKRTLANLSALSAEVIEGLKVLLRGGVALASAEEAFVIERSLPHGTWPPCSARPAPAAPISGLQQRLLRYARW